MTGAKIGAIKEGFIGRKNIKAEDLAIVDELSKKVLDENSKKRKKNVDEIEDGRWPKRPKYTHLSTIEPPALSTDNILEIFSYFNNENSVLRALSLVNKQFNLVARSLMYKYGMVVNVCSLLNMDDTMVNFARKIQTLAIKYKHFEPKNDTSMKYYYMNALTKLTNLSSLNFQDEAYKEAKLEVLAQLTQLTELKFGFTIIEEDWKYFTNLTGLKSLRVGGDSKFQQTNGLETFAAQLKHLHIKMYGNSFNISPFKNIESLDLLGFRRINGIKTMLESLPKLTSLVTYNFAGDMSKLTSLKTLRLTDQRFICEAPEPYDITAFPPRLEIFRCASENIKCDFPPSIKSVYVGRIEDDHSPSQYDKNVTRITSMLDAVAKLRCSVTLEYQDFDMFSSKPFTAAAQNPNLTIIVEEDRYTEGMLKRFSQFCEGPLPSTLYIRFHRWKGASRKKKFGELLEELSTKIRLFVDYIDLGGVQRRAFNNDYY